MRFVAFLGVAASLWLATACTAVLGITDVPNPTCNGATASNPCEACLSSECCDQLTACSQDPNCGNYLTCVNSCNNNQTCADACGNQFAAGQEVESLVLSCGNQFCTAACQ